MCEARQPQLRPLVHGRGASPQQAAKGAQAQGLWLRWETQRTVRMRDHPMEGEAAPEAGLKGGDTREVTAGRGHILLPSLSPPLIAVPCHPAVGDASLACPMHPVPFQTRNA